MNQFQIWAHIWNSWTISNSIYVAFWRWFDQNWGKNMYSFNKTCWRKNSQTKYSSLLNNRAANLILFWKKSILHVLIPSYTFINFWIFLAKTFFYTNEKWKSPSYTALFHPTRLLIFGILPSYTFIPSYTIIKETRVLASNHQSLFKLHSRSIQSWFSLRDKT